ncbi:hypothetical protein ACFYUV_03875 [Nonomuraea sp. NPDC003560]|uniref:hypothetical protein n=1 Tax=Nonomuraea sp. NPDC003560 TaxID=3364341 RepID=UPI0036B58A7C
MNCHISWCTVPHKSNNETGHSATVATFTDLMVIAILLEQPDPEQNEGWIRMVYPIGDRQRHHDITPTAAADWSETLAAIDMRELSSIAQALYRAGVTLGASK